MKYCTSRGSNAFALKAYSLPAEKDVKGEAQAAKGCVEPCNMNSAPLSRLQALRLNSHPKKTQHKTPTMLTFSKVILL